MFDHLQIYARRERWLVGLADVMLTPLSWGRRRTTDVQPMRVLLLRLERIGDLLMTHGAIARARQLWPDAQIDLAVGSWNAPLARLMPEVSQVDVLDVPWLAREGTGLSWPALVARARDWRTRRYDLVVNFEPDIRSNALAWLSGARHRAGYWTGGGGAFLTTALAFEPTAHVDTNASQLLDVFAASDAAAMPEHTARLIPDAASASAAAEILAQVPPDHRLIGLHVAGGRESKQWHLARFAEVGRTLAAEGRVTLVLTGGPGDRALVDAVKADLRDAPVVDTAGALDLPATAALLSRLTMLVTGDTGPMHLASAVGTPVIALFGPSDPRRYGPLATHQQVLRVQLPCSPCGQVRLPPERCRGHVPDCMDGITVAAVVDAAQRWLREGVTR
jgi:lipopolysaccharide heptosyltransferase II